MVLTKAWHKMYIYWGGLGCCGGWILWWLLLLEVFWLQDGGIIIIGSCKDWYYMVVYYDWYYMMVYYVDRVLCNWVLCCLGTMECGIVFTVVWNIVSLGNVVFGYYGMGYCGIVLLWIGILWSFVVVGCGEVGYCDEWSS